MSALSRYEAEYLAGILPAADIVHRQCADFGGGQDIERTDTAILVSELRTLDDMALVREVVSQLNEFGLSVRIRSTPGLTGLNSENFWREKLVDSDLSLLSCGAHQSFEHLLAQQRPRLVVAWISTTLVDALYEGILPVCLAKDDDPYIEDSLFPLFECCLRWPRDLDTIRVVCDDDKEYWRVLERLRTNENRAGAMRSVTRGYEDAVSQVR